MHVLDIHIIFYIKRYMDEVSSDGPPWRFCGSKFVKLTFYALWPKLDKKTHTVVHINRQKSMD